MAQTTNSITYGMSLTATDLIDESIATGEIASVTVRMSDEVRVLCTDLEVQSDDEAENGGTHEYWGTEDDGTGPVHWRVHVHIL